MSEFLFHAHSGLRYLVLLAGVLAALYYLVALATRRPRERAGRVLLAVFVGLLDVQVLLGVALVVAGIFYPALIGHIVMMVVAAVFAHGLSVASRRTPIEQRSYLLALSGVLLALGSVVAGIMAIGRPVF